VRLNFSHGTHEEHAGFIAMVRSVGERLGHHIPIVQDLSGLARNFHCHRFEMNLLLAELLEL
jgi:pyruvate kinase